MNASVEESVRSALSSPANPHSYGRLVQQAQDLVRDVSIKHSAGASQQSDLVALLRALAAVATTIRHDQHQHLLQILYSFSFWNTSREVSLAWIQLVMNLVRVRSIFMDPCVQHLVRSLLPPTPATTTSAPAAAGSAPGAPGEYRPCETTVCVHQLVVDALNQIMLHAHAAVRLVKDEIAHQMPHRVVPKDWLCTYFHGVISLAESPAGTFVRDSVLLRMLDRAVEIDAEILWQQILPHLSGREAREEEGEPDDPEEDGDEDEDLVDDLDQLLLSAASRRAQPPPAARSPPVQQQQQQVPQQAAANSAADRQKGWGACEGWEGAHSQPCLNMHPSVALDAATHKSLSMAQKLDGVMLMLARHLARRAAGGPNERRALWKAACDAFDTVMLPSQRVKFSPFALFHAASLCGPAAACELADILTRRVCDPGLAALTRTACAAYAASFVARCTLLPSSAVLAACTRLAEFADRYAHTTRTSLTRSRSAGRHPTQLTARSSLLGGASTRPPLGRASSDMCVRDALWGLQTASSSSTQLWLQAELERNEVFYAAVQALMYVLCYHMRGLERPAAGGWGAAEAPLVALVRERILPLLMCHLAPLQVCLRTVCAEFCRLVERLQLGEVPGPSLLPPAASGPIRRLETFFPFDPYLLPLSQPVLQLSESYRHWHDTHTDAHAAPGADQAITAGRGEAGRDSGGEDVGDLEMDVDSEGDCMESGSDVDEGDDDEDDDDAVQRNPFMYTAGVGEGIAWRQQAAAVEAGPWPRRCSSAAPMPDANFLGCSPENVVAMPCMAGSMAMASAAFVRPAADGSRPD